MTGLPQITMYEMAGILLAVCVLWRAVANLRGFLAVFGGAFIAVAIGVVAALILAEVYRFWCFLRGVSPQDWAQQASHSVVFWVVGAALAILCTFYAGFVAGMVARDHEAVHAGLAAVVGMSVVPTPEGLPAGFWGEAIVWLGRITMIAVVVWGGHAAKRSKPASEPAALRSKPVTPL